MGAIILHVKFIAFNKLKKSIVNMYCLLIVLSIESSKYEVTDCEKYICIWKWHDAAYYISISLHGCMTTHFKCFSS